MIYNASYLKLLNISVVQVCLIYKDFPKIEAQKWNCWIKNRNIFEVLGI